MEDLPGNRFVRSIAHAGMGMLLHLKIVSLVTVQSSCLDVSAPECQTDFPPESMSEDVRVNK